MKNEKDTLGELFNRFEGQWDTEHPSLGHQERFLDKLGGKKKTGFPFKIAVPVAAVLAILMGLLVIFNPYTKNDDATALNNMSPQAKEAQLYFSGIIKKELAKVEKENTPETKKLVSDALNRLQTLEDDYNKLTLELQQKGESKQIIHAMITNLQTRISFLEEVLTRIENIKKIKENYNEKYS